ncbi:hypothetical protein BX600DRAFT_434079 [Xylariales sp. PMI_506]|nr:hypothetical protein BX600DRAFT_434079 [Xylariales sp. PMI_506]
MKSALLAPIALFAAQSTAATEILVARDDEDYLNSVCEPTSFDQNDVPPCIEISTIEALCAPNGTSALDYEAHAQCMCGGSYFPEWTGCRNCLYVHGGLSELNLTYWASVITTASNLLCTGTPTASFADLFTSAQAEVPVPTSGNTALSDISSGDSAVSLYYTATVSAGPGKITGSAALATATGDGSASGGTSTAANTGSSGATTKATTGATSKSTGSSSTSTSKNAAGPTAVAGGSKNLLIAVAGGALMAAL